jgi:hypothetical protein
VSGGSHRGQWATGRIDGIVAMATAFGMFAKPEQESDSHEDVVQTLE